MADLLQQGITAYQTGKRDDSRKLFIAAIHQNPNDESAWGWMYNVCDNDKERIDCLKQVLRINPSNEKANRLFNKLSGRSLTNIPVPPKIIPQQSNQVLSQPKKKKSKFWLYVILAVALLIGIYFMGENFGNKSTGGEVSSGSNNAGYSSGERHIISDYYFGCKDRSQFEKIGSYASNHDQQAFTRAVDEGLIDGSCVAFTNNEIVYLTDTALFSGLIKVRPQGETQEYWTNVEAAK
jgi:hypothetical protein